MNRFKTYAVLVLLGISCSITPLFAQELPRGEKLGSGIERYFDAETGVAIYRGQTNPYPSGVQIAEPTVNMSELKSKKLNFSWADTSAFGKMRLLRRVDREHGVVIYQYRCPRTPRICSTFTLKLSQ